MSNHWFCYLLNTVWFMKKCQNLQIQRCYRLIHQNLKHLQLNIRSRLHMVLEINFCINQCFKIALTLKMGKSNLIRMHNVCYSGQDSVLFRQSVSKYLTKTSNLLLFFLTKVIYLFSSKSKSNPLVHWNFFFFSTNQNLQNGRFNNFCTI